MAELEGMLGPAKMGQDIPTGPGLKCQVLRDSFGTPDNIEWHKTSCTIFNTWIREGASVTDHVMYMIE